MNTWSRTIAGTVSMGIGVVLGGVALTQTSAIADLLIGGATSLFFIGVGAYIFFNTNEDTIEEVTTDND